MNNNYNSNDLYIILSSIRSQKDGYTIEDLKNYALATNSADAFINLLDLDRIGKYFNGSVAVQKAVDKIISENPESAIGLHLSATVEAIRYARERMNEPTARLVKGHVRLVNEFDNDIKSLNNQIAEFADKPYDDSLHILNFQLNNTITIRERVNERIDETNCGELYKKAMLAYLEEAKSLNPAGAQICKAKAFILNRALAFEKQFDFSCDELKKASKNNPDNIELKCLAITCVLISKSIESIDESEFTYQKMAGNPSCKQSILEFKELAQLSLSSEGQRAVECLAFDSSTADEMGE